MINFGEESLAIGWFYKNAKKLNSLTNLAVFVPDESIFHI